MPKLKQVFGKEFYSVPEAAKCLGVSRMTVLRWVSDEQHPMHGKVRGFKHPLTNHYYLDIKTIDRLADKLFANSPGKERSSIPRSLRAGPGLL